MGPCSLLRAARPVVKLRSMAQTTVASNAPIEDTEFEALRATVFAQNPSTPVIDLDEAFDFCKRELADRNVCHALSAAKQAQRTLVQPRAGVGNLEGEHILLQTLEEAGADILPVTIDSLTRTLRFDQASKAASESTLEQSKLNGYPLIHHGVQNTRELVLARERPVHLRGNSTDLRLVAEVGFASGLSGFVSGPVYATVQYSKDVPLEESIRNWQYCYRLMGRYTEAGIPIADDALGLTQSGTCSVPALMHAGVVLEALIMAGQGVKHVLSYAIAQGTMAQDVAAVIAVAELCEEYLARLGFDDVNVYRTSNHWGSAFPPDEAAAYGLICSNTLVAATSRSTMLHVKSVEEGFGVPTAQGNAASVRATRYVLHLLQNQLYGLDSAEVKFEYELNLMQARAILDAALELGDGDPVQATIRAFEAGVLDEPAAPSRVAHGDILVLRDAKGAVRFLDYGNVPIPEEARKLERERLAEREKIKGAPLGYDDIVRDIDFMVGRGVI
jgi:methylaspartate mutase epsilon subunit